MHAHGERPELLFASAYDSGVEPLRRGHFETQQASRALLSAGRDVNFVATISGQAPSRPVLAAATARPARG